MRATNKKHCFAWATNTQHGILARPVWKKLEKKPLFDTTTIRSQPEITKDAVHITFSVEEEAAQVLKEKIDS